MSDVVISAEGLGKKYLIGHEASRERNDTFRDAIVRTAKGLAHSALDMARGRQLVAGNEIEEFWALKDVSFEIKRGEVVGIIGRNGAGKSTLLKILSRITEPSEGRVEIKGRVASLLEVGTGFHPELTGRENIFLNGAILGMSRAEIRRKFDEIVAFAEVEKFLDTPVKHYSSGMYVRLAFAVAAHLEPEILIVDEVLAVGDAEFQKKCLGKMQDVAGHGRTVLFVSHQLPSVRSLCGRAFLMEKGYIQKEGAAAALIDFYLSKVTNNECLHLQTAGLARPSCVTDKPSIISVTVNGQKPLKHGQPAKFEIAFELSKHVSELVFAVAFCSLDGTRIMSVDSDIPGPRVDLAAETHGRAEISIDRLHLAPSTYLFDVGLRSGDNFLLDYLPGLITLTISPSAETPAAIAMRNNGQGGVRYPCHTNLIAFQPSEMTA